MNKRPFGKKIAKPDEALAEPSTKDRLLSRSCTKDEFYLLISKLLQERLLGFTVEFIGESVLRLVNADGRESTAQLTNLWLKYSRETEDRSELIEKYVRFAASLTSAKVPLDREKIVPTIKDAEYMKSINPDKTMTEHLCGDLWIIYAVDLPETINTLGRDDMTAAGISENELRPLAIGNLQRILPEVERHGDGPLYQLIAGRDYVASLLLFDWMWDQLAESIDGQIVATVPSRDVLLYTGSTSEEGLREIREQSANVAISVPHSISESLIVRKDGKWTVFNAN